MTLKPEHIERGDNLRLVQPHKLPTAKAALKLAEAFEAGTAMICLGRAVTSEQQANIGASVRYRALAGEVYDAKIVFIRDFCTVDLDVFLPGCKEPLRLTRITLNRTVE